MVKRVNIGAVKGETPRKIFYFNKLDAPDQVESATPERAFFGEDVPLKSLLKKAIDTVDEEVEENPYASPESSSRPTTSRGKSRPSPEEFASYVVPSPERGSGSVEGKVLVFGDEEDSEAANVVESAVSGKEDWKGNEGYEKELVAIGCWLFGSALSV